jgi:hypothetical protein
MHQPAFQLGEPSRFANTNLSQPESTTLATIQLSKNFGSLSQPRSWVMQPSPQDRFILAAILHLLNPNLSSPPPALGSNRPSDLQAATELPPPAILATAALLSLELG